MGDFRYINQLKSLLLMAPELYNNGTKFEVGRLQGVQGEKKAILERFPSISHCSPFFTEKLAKVGC